MNKRLLKVKKGDLVKAPKFTNLYRNPRKYFEVGRVQKYEFEGEQCIAIEDEYGNDLAEYVTEILTKDSKGNFIKRWEEQ